MNKTVNPTASESNSMKNADDPKYVMMLKTQLEEDERTIKESLTYHTKQFIKLCKSSYDLGVSQGACLWVGYALLNTFALMVMMALQIYVIPNNWQWIAPPIMILVSLILGRIFNQIEKKGREREKASLDQLEKDLIEAIEKEES